ncbi:MAG: hypothetical protein JNN28_14810 [Saprospiraceae bacterium]|nr:hypothetical protein [Saprospiraceae bacterium]
MKKQPLSKASNSLFGILLMLGVFSASLQSSVNCLSSLLTEIRSQWSNFEEHLSDMNPHRTIFPN